MSSDFNYICLKRALSHFVVSARVLERFVELLFGIFFPMHYIETPTDKLHFKVYGFHSRVTFFRAETILLVSFAKKLWEKLIKI